MKFAWGILPVLLIASLALLPGCSTLETPEYVGPGEMKSTYGRRPASIPQSDSESIVDNIQLMWPVPYPPKLNRGFKPGKTRKSRHQGIDLGGAKNTPIFAAHEGYVIYAGRGFRGFGKMIIIENQNGFASFYAHLNSIKIKEGQYVQSGQRIGQMGRTGHASGVHLHFELRIAEIPIDPMPYFNRQ